MTVILLATVIAFVIARQDVRNRAAIRHPVSVADKTKASVDSLSEDIRQLRSEVEEETVVEEVLENPWFDWTGFAGTAIVISSFYMEWMVRRSKSV